MFLSPLTISGAWFLDDEGRRVRLRGVNLGGDCKVPYPDGGTDKPTDFSDHKSVSFVGRPFPIEEADEHFARLAAWGFNCVRLLTTWEAVEHAGPGIYDRAYLDYFATICAKAGEHGLYVFVDFHQDAWSRMSGGDGAPGWTFDAAGLNFTTFHAAGATHVMQYKYDYASDERRQEHDYPTMTWAQNYRMPANAIMWTLFFGGNIFVPDFLIEGQPAQDYLQGHYLGAMTEVAKAVADMLHVLGFDTLNEPSTGWIGKPLSYRHLEPSDEHPARVVPGPAWSPLDGLGVAQGCTAHIPELKFSREKMAVVPVETKTVNPDGVEIWNPGHACPFEQAGAYRLTNEGPEALDEEFFRMRNGQRLDPEADFMVPFFGRVAETIRSIKPEWMVFAEVDPFRGVVGEGFPEGMPERTVNASHWYDIITLVTKRFNYPDAFNPLTGETLNGADEIEASYTKQLERLKTSSTTLLEGNGPTLVGEFGIPFDLDRGAAYDAWAAGDRSDDLWQSHVTALDLMYNALDNLQLHSTHWNYTASNSNDLRVGDGWNQEDLSIFSRDQQTSPNDINSGGRALKGFVRPFLRVCAGEPESIRFDRHSGTCHIAFDAAEGGVSEIFVPSLQYPEGFDIAINGDARAETGADTQSINVIAEKAGPVRITLTRRG